MLLRRARAAAQLRAAAGGIPVQGGCRRRCRHHAITRPGARCCVIFNMENRSLALQASVLLLPMPPPLCA